MQHYYLYEHRTHLPVAKLGMDVNTLRGHLQQLWDNRPRVPFWRASEDDGSTSQRFLRFHGDDGTVSISARNYVGQIQLEGCTLHLLPKIFYPGKDAVVIEPSEHHLQAMHAHLFWWLSYSNRLRFPRSLSAFAAQPTSLLEVLIWLFAQYTHELLSRSHYQHYQEVSEDLSTLRGHLNFGTYAGYYATGRGHHLPCTYDSFQLDNRFNRILKYVTYRLLHLSNQPESRRLLQEIHFQLDEVGDQVATLTDCDGVRLSPLFDDFRVVLDYCRLFLADSAPLAAHSEEVRVFALLMPTEVLFEQFIEGFVRQHLADAFKVRSQTKGLYLAHVKPAHGKSYARFELRHDLLLESHAHSFRQLIVDVKYKLLSLDQEAGDGVAQADMYQLASYALRRGTPHTHLFYPDSLLHLAEESAGNRLDYEIEEQLSGNNMLITVSAHRLPIVLRAAFDADQTLREGYADLIFAHEQQLISRLRVNLVSEL